MKSKLFLISYVILFMLIPVLGLAQAKGDAKAGKEKYDSLCGGCHGTSGKGDGSAAGGLNPKPQDHTDCKTMAEESDATLVKVIKEGVSASDGLR